MLLKLRVKNLLNNIFYWCNEKIKNCRYCNITIFVCFELWSFSDIITVAWSCKSDCCCCQLLSRQSRSRSRSCPHHVLSCPEALAAGAEIKKQSRSETIFRIRKHHQKSSVISLKANEMQFLINVCVEIWPTLWYFCVLWIKWSLKKGCKSTAELKIANGYIIHQNILFNLLAFFDLLNCKYIERKRKWIVNVVASYAESW